MAHSRNDTSGRPQPGQIFVRIVVVALVPRPCEQVWHLIFTNSCEPATTLDPFRTLFADLFILDPTQYLINIVILEQLRTLSFQQCDAGTVETSDMLRQDSALFLTQERFSKLEQDTCHL